MSASKITAPKGTGDIFFPQVEKWQYLEDKIRAYYSRFLYREMRTPMFEHSELFERGIGSETEVVQKEMYTFSDKAGRSLTLRPENTAAVARAAIENNLFNDMFPLRFFYIGPMFRYEKPQKGRQRQFHQFGIEVFGDDSAGVDAEIIYSAFHFLKEIGIADTEVHVNSVGCKACRPGYVEKLAQQAAAQETELCPDCRRKVHTNPLRIFDCKNETCIQVSDRFAKITDHLCAGCRDHFGQLQEGLHLLGVPYKENPRMVRGLDYYIRTAFEITSAKLGAQDALLGGGRYDNLVEEVGGPAMPGTGFAAGMERIILHLDEGVAAEQQKTIILVAYQDTQFQGHALKVCEILWRRGLCAYINYNAKNLKKQFKRGDRVGAHFTFILGEEEVRENSIAIKDMASREQITIKQEELDRWLDDNTRK